MTITIIISADRSQLLYVHIISHNFHYFFLTTLIPGISWIRTRKNNKEEWYFEEQCIQYNNTLFIRAIVQDLKKLKISEGKWCMSEWWMNRHCTLSQMFSTFFSVLADCPVMFWLWTVYGCPMAWAVTCWSLSVEDLVWSQASSSGICSGVSGTGRGFSLTNLVFHISIILTMLKIFNIFARHSSLASASTVILSVPELSVLCDVQ